MGIRTFALTFAILCAPGRVGAGEPRQDSPQPDPEFLKALDASIDRAVKALVAKQSEDGAWRSETYGLFKPGVAATAFVLEALSRLPEDQRKPHAEQIAKAMQFLRKATDKNGAVGMKGEWPEYPTYTTALCILTWRRLKPEGWQEEVKPWTAWLVSAQHSEDNGCKKDDLAYGGWNPQGRHMEGMPRHADISSTRYALQALGNGMVGKGAPAWERAMLFLERCAAPDNDARLASQGFFFSPTARDLNKAGPAGDGASFKPYASSSADGWLASQAVPTGDNFADPISFPFDREQFNRTPGIPGEQPERKDWDRAVIGYYRAALAELAGNKRSFKVPDGWWQRLAAATIKDQGASGLWKNEIIYMKEDDPLIASPMALRTLLGCRAAIK